MMRLLLNKMSARATWLAILPCMLIWSQASSAQATDAASDARRSNLSDEVEELIVRGRKPSDFRAALEVARVRVYDVFNDLNSDDAFDVHCRREASTGRRIKRQVCRPQFRRDISYDAARAYLSAIKDVCPGELTTQECIFGDEVATRYAAPQALSMAQAEESREGPMQKLFVNEFARVLLENPELQQAILDYEALEQAYHESRRGRRR